MALYRHGRLTDADLDAQMEEIGKEEAALEAQTAELRGRISGADSIGANISSALTASDRQRMLPVPLARMPVLCVGDWHQCRQ